MRMTHICGHRHDPGVGVSQHIPLVRVWTELAHARGGKMVVGHLVETLHGQFSVETSVESLLSPAGVPACRWKHGEQFGGTCTSKRTALSRIGLFSRFRDRFTPWLSFVPWPDMFLNGWTSERDLLLPLAREVLTVHSSLAAGRILRDSLPFPYRPAVHLNWPVECDSQGYHTCTGSALSSSTIGCSQCL